MFALVMLVAAGALAYWTEAGVANSRDWVVHTYASISSLEELQLSLAAERASSMSYLLSQNSAELQEYYSRAAEAPRIMAVLQSQLQDNPDQQKRISQLQELLQKHQASVEDIIATQLRGGLPDKVTNAALINVWMDHNDIQALVREMEADEQTLLRKRLNTWDRLFRRNLMAVSLTFVAAMLLLFYNFRFFFGELARTGEVQRLERESAESYRALSARIIELQDTERRKIARELHDSVGQYLAGLKINLGRLETRLRDAAPGVRDLASETTQLAERAVTEVRTISHLLHPPLLEELGLVAAVKWYAEGFAKRSGIQFRLDLAETAERLPREIDLALFRVLQEALTNVHRHSGADAVEIRVGCTRSEVDLSVRDNGHGIPQEKLARFRSGLAGGIGLAGMKERLGELGGRLSVESSSSGTLITATLPTVLDGEEMGTAVAGETPVRS